MPRKTTEPLYEKAWKRQLRDTVDERDAGYGRVLDHGKGYSVQLFWETGQKAGENQMFRIEISGRGLEKRIELLLNAEQLMKYLRWV